MGPKTGLKDLFGQEGSSEHFPLSLPVTHCRDSFNGSAAIFQCAKLLDLDSRHTILVPIYMCGSEIGPFSHLECQLSFYDIKDNLQCDLEGIRQQLESGAVDVILVTHYFGFAQQDIEEIARIAKENQVVLIEDCAHALFANWEERSLGSFGDFAIFSPRKSLPLTEGGLLVSNHTDLTMTLLDGEKPPLVPALDRQLNDLLAHYQSSANQSSANQSSRNILNRLVIFALLPVSTLVKVVRIFGRRFHSTWISPELDGPAAVPIYEVRMSQRMRHILYSTDADSVVDQRRKNYEAIRRAVETNDHCEAVLPAAPPGCVPLYFPVLVEDSASLVRALANERIAAYQWWNHQHEAVSLENHPRIQHWKSHMVALPIHQGLNDTDIQRIIDVLTRQPGV